jgi:hypothetical protein
MSTRTANHYASTENRRPGPDPAGFALPLKQPWMQQWRALAEND